MYIQNNILTINNLFEMPAGKFMHSYEINQPLSHLTNSWNLFRQFVNTRPDLHVQIFSSYPG